MCDPRWPLGVAVALTVLVVGGCASSATTPISSETEARPAGTESPSNFASPTDLFQRYPTMRHQRL